MFFADSHKRTALDDSPLNVRKRTRLGSDRRDSYQDSNRLREREREREKEEERKNRYVMDPDI